MEKVFILFAALTAAQFSFAQQEQDSIKSIRIQEVQVISNRATEKTPLSFSNVGKEEINKQNFGQDIPFLIALTPSVVTTSDAGTGIGYTAFRIRGTDASRINITVNGVPMNDAESQAVFWVDIPDFATSLQDLQIQRGVGTSTNGAGAFGASVNMKTENIPAQPYGELNGSYGSFNTSRVALKLGTGIIGNHFAFDARLSGINSDGYIDRASTDLKSYFFQGTYYNDKDMLKFVVFGGEETTYHAWDGVPQDSLKTHRTYNPCGYMGNDAQGRPMFYHNQTDNYIQTNYQLVFLHVFRPDLKLNATLHYTKGDGYYEEYKQSQTLSEYSLNPFIYEGELVTESDLIRRQNLDNYFGGGIFSLDYNKGKWDASLGGGANYYYGRHIGEVMWMKNYAGDADFYPEQRYYLGDGRKTDANIYARANYMLLPSLSLFADLQYRYIKYKIGGQNDTWDWNTSAMQTLDIDEQFDFFNPKFGVFYQLNRQNEFYASFAVANREPSRTDYTDAEGDKMPVSERLLDYELGYKFKSSVFSAGVNLYYMKYKNQLILTGKVNDIGEALSSNIPDSYRTGIELTAGVKPLAWMRWDGNLTLSANKIKDYSEYANIYDENYDWVGQQENYLGTTDIAYSPNVIANSLFSFSYKQWDAAFHSSYVGKQYLDNSGSDDRKIDAYFVNNLRLGYTFKMKGIKTINLGLLINNIFNAKYESNGYVYDSFYDSTGMRFNDLRYFPQAGTNVLVNLNIAF